MSKMHAFAALAIAQLVVIFNVAIFNDGVVKFDKNLTKWLAFEEWPSKKNSLSILIKSKRLIFMISVGDTSNNGSKHFWKVL